MGTPVERFHRELEHLVEAKFWPTAHALDFGHLVSTGWQPEPFTTFLCKVHSRCNLNCSYCFVYNMADQSWRSKPKVMALSVVRETASRIREHVLKHGLKRIAITMHGGEPLLTGADYLRQFTETMLSSLSDVTEVTFLMQTNGTLLTPEIAGILVERNINVGVSLDGPEAINDMYRVFRDGRPSYQAVRNGLAVLADPQYKSCFNGFLCTINLVSDPCEVFDHLSSFKPHGIDFLFPHGNWSAPPPGKQHPFDDTPYADWLIPIFDLWYERRPKEVDIRLFSVIINLLFGGATRLESIGIGAVNIIVIEANGNLEGIDSLKSTFDGAPNLALNVFSNSFDDALQHPSVIARQIGLEALHPICQSCNLRKVCGAGYYPHRYEERTGFKNPTVYCSDLTKLIKHIHQRVMLDVDRLLPTLQPPVPALAIGEVL